MKAPMILAAGLLAAPASADVLIMKDGRIFDGFPLEKSEGTRQGDPRSR